MTPYYEHGGITIYHGDCRDVLPLVAYDAVITDPPYGVEFKGKATKWTSPSGGYASIPDTAGDIDAVVLPVITGIVSGGCRAVITPGRRSMFRYPEPKTVGTIFYPSGAGMNSWGFTCSQPIYYYGKDPYLAARRGSRPDSFSTTESAAPNGHPCPKPLGTMRWLVRRGSLPGEVVCDPFMGSGTTLHAAQLEGRKAIGIEIEERYCEIAAERLRQEVLPLEQLA
jgi:DNA modification methylase